MANPILGIIQALLARKAVQASPYGRGAPPAGGLPTRPIPGLSTGMGGPVGQVDWNSMPAPGAQPYNPSGINLLDGGGGGYPGGIGAVATQQLGQGRDMFNSAAAQEIRAQPDVRALDTSGAFSRDFEGTPLGYDPAMDPLQGLPMDEGNPEQAGDFSNLDTPMGMGGQGLPPEAYNAGIEMPGQVGVTGDAWGGRIQHDAPPLEWAGQVSDEDLLREQGEQDMLMRSRGMQDIILELLSRRLGQ